MPKKVIVVGGGDSGRAAVRAALRAPTKPHVMLIEKKSEEGIKGAQTISNSDVLEVIPEDKLVRIKSNHGRDLLRYDALIIATGSQVQIPKYLAAKDGVFSAKHALQSQIPSVKHIVFYGLGMYGLTIIPKFENREIVVVEPENEILLGILDPFMASKVRDFLSRKGVKFFLSERIEKVYGYERISGIETETGFKPVDALIVDLGMVPRGEILSRVVKLGLHGGIPTDAFQGAGVEGIYACGSCAEVNDASLEFRRPIPTLDVSYKSGMIAGYNAAGLRLATHGYVRKVGLDVYGLEILSVGATETETEKYGIPHYTVEVDFRGAIVKVVLERNTGRVLGVQSLGPGSLTMSEWMALAIKKRMTVHELLAHHFSLSAPAPIALNLALEEAIK